MSLCKLSEILNCAKNEKRAVGAFNVGNMEMVSGAVAAAELTKTPIILQIAEPRFIHCPVELMGPMMVEAAERSSVPISVHLDHSTTPQAVKLALELGFTSVMFDGSMLPLEENIKRTAEIKAMADEYGADVEAEVGVLGKKEDGSGSDNYITTAPGDAEYFAENTGVEALAVAIGNAHGFYMKSPKLRFDVLEEIAGRVDIPLVLHGGTGLTDEDFHRCIELGIRKINIASATFQALTDAAQTYFKNKENGNFFDLTDEMVKGARDCIASYIRVFNGG